jgi:hypothetical protein
MLHPAIIERRDVLVSSSAMLFRSEWQHAIAKELGQFHPDGPRDAIDSRLIRRWASGERVVPNWVVSALARILELRVSELDTMRVRVSFAAARLAAQVTDAFSVARHTVDEIWIEHRPTGDVFEFDRSGCQIAGGYTYVPGPMRTDPDNAESRVLAESAREAARQFLTGTAEKGWAFSSIN